MQQQVIIETHENVASRLEEHLGEADYLLARTGNNKCLLLAEKFLSNFVKSDGICIGGVTLHDKAGCSAISANPKDGSLILELSGGRPLRKSRAIFYGNDVPDETILAHAERARNWVRNREVYITIPEAEEDEQGFMPDLVKDLVTLDRLIKKVADKHGVRTVSHSWHFMPLDNNLLDVAIGTLDAFELYDTDKSPETAKIKTWYLHTSNGNVYYNFTYLSPGGENKLTSVCLQLNEDKLMKKEGIFLNVRD